MVAMLQSSWRGGGSLAGYQQQDAHEYLQFILNSLHSANIDPDEKEQKAEDCDCIIHRTFCGVLQSAVTCTKCKNVTTARDPFMDLSLDVRQPGLKKKLTLTAGKDKSAPPSPPVALLECLDRFTAPETLPAADYTCTRCASAQQAIKRLSLARLPPVLPVHLKRFSHSKKNGASVKLDTRVRFPMAVDLGPYLTVPPEAGKKDPAAGEEAGKDDPPVKPIYELSSVIVHKGKMDSGHYISYSRVYDEWFMFDDSKVVLVEENEVLGSEAYMLFYVIKEIDV